MRFLDAAARGFRRVAAFVASAIPPLLRDLIGIGGAAMIVFGVWQMHPPSAWIVAGAMAMLTAFRLAKSPAAEPDEAE